MKHIAYIHGLNSTHSSFNYIVKQLPGHTAHFVNYASHQNLTKSIADCVAQIFLSLPKTVKVSVVGHSLGGVIAAIIAADYPNRVENLVTISAPLGGSRAAMALRWMPGGMPIIHDIVPTSPIINRCMDLELVVPTLSIVSTSGHMATSTEQNDSVVALSSQRGLRFGTKVDIESNHFEVLTSEHTVKVIRSFLFGGIK